VKKIIKEEEIEGLEKLLGEKVTLFCCRYIYTGELVGVNDVCVLLKNPAIVYETGAFSEKDWKDCQGLCAEEFYIATQSIESFGILK
jgi:hypothetical protein